MSTDLFNQLKRLVLIALVSDDELMDTLVLKGGNAIELIHGLGSRASVDLDFSIENDLPDLDLVKMTQKIDRLLKQTMQPAGFEVFDVAFTSQPPQLTPDLTGFWGGYRIQFKIISSKVLQSLGDNVHKARIRAVPMGKGGSTTFSVDISKYEYCRHKQPAQINGYRVYAYTPEMIVCEKLRAICQQFREYRELLKSIGASPRPRDFFDIYCLIDHFKIDTRSDNIDLLLREMFAIKHVPLTLLGKLHESREFHRSAYASLRNTVAASTDLKPFDFYFDFVLARVQELKPLWEKNPPPR